jgi:hypothetical protein
VSTMARTGGHAQWTRASLSIVTTVWAACYTAAMRAGLLCRPAAGAAAPYKDFTLTTTQSSSRAIRCAIWWPEGTSAHNDIDLSLYAPDSSTPLRTSFSEDGVWERVATTSTGYTGNYRVRITGYSFETTSQRVFLWCSY